MTDDTVTVDPRLDWVVSYPKSGNTWVRMLVAHYWNRTPHSMRFGIDIGEYFFGAVSTIPVERLNVAHQIQLRGAALLALAHRNRGHRTLLKSHHVNGVIRGMQTFAPQWTRAAIYVVRDPRDIVASYAHHTGSSLEGAASDLADHRSGLSGDRKGAHHIGSWSGHVSAWLSEQRFPACVVRYEDLHADTGRELRRILEHLETPDIDDELIEVAVEKARFENVRGAEDRAGFPEASSRTERFFRKGEAGGWREELPDELARRVETDHGEVMEELGYELEATRTEPDP